jgi:hypothetical protein
MILAHEQHSEPILDSLKQRLILRVRPESGIALGSQMLEFAPLGITEEARGVRCGRLILWSLVGHETDSQDRPRRKQNDHKSGP